MVKTGIGTLTSTDPNAVANILYTVYDRVDGDKFKVISSRFGRLVYCADKIKALQSLTYRPACNNQKEAGLHSKVRLFSYFFNKSSMASSRRRDLGMRVSSESLSHFGINSFFKEEVNRIRFTITTSAKFITSGNSVLIASL